MIKKMICCLFILGLISSCKESANVESNATKKTEKKQNTNTKPVDQTRDARGNYLK